MHSFTVDLHFSSDIEKSQARQFLQTLLDDAIGELARFGADEDPIFNILSQVNIRSDNE